MSDIAISLRGVSKMYRIFEKPIYKVLDSLGYTVESKVQEFWAVRDIDLDIYKGTRVGLLGRNGAGKSTLLKMISDNIRPTTGDIRINGHVSALLELGTGFHPEFSGRENVFASLSYMGVTGREAQKKYEEIVQFSELEEFIERPIKTYSAGMYARLAFSTATAIEPEILIIDEILGAGDAYFASKSVERMKRLTENGVTVLFVSHDLASLQKLCDYAVWIDRGRVVMKGDTLTVSKAYMASIREQEEARLKARSEQAISGMGGSLKALRTAKSLLFHIIADEWKAPEGKHPISSVQLEKRGRMLSKLDIGDAMDNDINQDCHVIEKIGYINWSKPQQLAGKYCRIFENNGAESNHAAWTLSQPIQDDGSELSVRIEYFDCSKEPIHLEWFDGNQYRRMGTIPAYNDQKWKTIAFELPKHFFLEGELREGAAANIEDAPANAPVESEAMAELESEREGIPSHDSATFSDVYGSRELEIVKVDFLSNGVEQRIFGLADPMTIRIHYKAKTTVLDPVFVVAIYGLDGTVIHQAISSLDGVSLGFLHGAGYVDVEYEKLSIGQGHYVVSVGIFKYVDLSQQRESPAYCVHDRKYEFRIEQPPEYQMNLGIVQQFVRWEIGKGE